MIEELWTINWKDLMSIERLITSLMNDGDWTLEVAEIAATQSSAYHDSDDVDAVIIKARSESAANV